MYMWKNGCNGAKHFLRLAGKIIVLFYLFFFLFTVNIIMNEMNIMKLVLFLSMILI